jgi:hypothetical protein
VRSLCGGSGGAQVRCVIELALAAWGPRSPPLTLLRPINIPSVWFFPVSPHTSQNASPTAVSSMLRCCRAGQPAHPLLLGRLSPALHAMQAQWDPRKAFN